MKYVCAAVFGLGAFFSMNCGTGDGASSGPTAERAETATTTGASVSVLGHDFDPPEVRIKVGERVRWTWVSGSHNVVSGARCVPDGVFSSGATTATPGAQFEHTFDARGEFPYYCDPHCGFGMVGRVIVE